MKHHCRNQMLLRAVIMGSVMCSGHLALAQGAEELDLDIYVVGEDATPAEVINQIPLPSPPTADIPPPVVDERLEELNTTTGTTLDDTTRTVTETINDAISSGDITKLPPEVDDLIPDEVIDRIIEGTGIDLPIDLTPTDTLDDTVDSVRDTVPDLPAQIDDIDAALDDLEADLETPEIHLPEVDQTIESLPAQEALPADEIPINTVDDALKALEDSAEDAAPATDDLVPDLLNR
jgi:hypothetical protein